MVNEPQKKPLYFAGNPLGLQLDEGQVIARVDGCVSLGICLIATILGG